MTFYLCIPPFPHLKSVNWSFWSQSTENGQSVCSSINLLFGKVRALLAHTVFLSTSLGLLPKRCLRQTPWWTCLCTRCRRVSKETTTCLLLPLEGLVLSVCTRLKWLVLSVCLGTYTSSGNSLAPLPRWLVSSLGSVPRAESSLHSRSWTVHLTTVFWSLP